MDNKEQRFFFKTQSSTSEVLKIFLKAYPNESLLDLENRRYAYAINGYKQRKGYPTEDVKEYDDTMWEGLTTEEYIKKYPLHFKDGYIINFKD